MVNNNLFGVRKSKIDEVWQEIYSNSAFLASANSYQMDKLANDKRSQTQNDGETVCS